MSRLNPKNLLCLLLAAVLVVLALAASQASANQPTYAFLMEFRDEYKYLESRWPKNDPTANYCVWEGISCDASGNVTIDLSNKGLDGDVPDFDDNYRSVGDQIMVVSIDLSSNNKVDGDLDEDWQYLTNLKYIKLDNTRVDGTLPYQWQNMNLQELHISNARLCGSLPTWNMRNLKVVDLSKNRMGGTLSESWTGMPSLTSVDISGNAFCGCVPTTWENVAALKSAASNANAAVRATDCSTSNKCGNSNRCQNAASGVVSLVASVAAIAAVAATMVF